MEEAWEYIWNNFFDKRTCLFYDYLVGDSEDAATWHLPSPELIEKLIPNPGGYGSGMEDSMLSAGTMMDTVVARYRVTGEPAMKTLADDIYRGMELCATVSEKKGFLPRSVSPVDRRSHYINSSRDQYTHWLYGAHRLYDSPLADERQKESIRRCLVNMAEMCEEDVRKENGWNILREDGRIGLVCEMWGDIQPSGYFRLPLFYLMAWHTTGNGHWKELYDGIRDTAWLNTEKHIPATSRAYVDLQVQYSVRLAYDLDPDESFRQTVLPFMKKMAEANEASVFAQAEKLLSPEGLAGLDWKYKTWDKAMAYYAGCYGGLAYYVPGQSELRENRAFYPLRSLGESLSAAALCPGYRVGDDSMQLLEKVADAVNYRTHVTYAPMALLNAYWCIRESQGNLRECV